MGSRYYDPRLGRFLSIDPVEPDENNLHSLNRYAYANNNPYKFTDPDGQIAETVVDVISLGLSIQAYRQDPSFINGLAVAYDGFATAVPFLPGGLGIIRQAASKGEKLTEIVKQAADRGAARAGEGAEKAATKNLLPKAPMGPGTVPKSERDPKRFFTPAERQSKRAEQDHLCANGCGTKIDESNSAGHHIKRHADGGRSVPENHAEVCVNCHAKIHSKESQ